MRGSAGSWSTEAFGDLGGNQIVTVQDFNDLGQFVGLAEPPGGGFLWGYVASPRTVPAPPSLALTAFGLAGLAGGRFRFRFRRP